MPARFVTVDRETPLLLPPDLQDWVAKDDPVRFVIEAVAECDLRLAKTNERGSGSRQYPPGMMLGLLIYCYAHGLFSSRQIERATYAHVSLRFLCADQHPDHDTIATFRCENGPLLEHCFAQVILYARELKAFSRLGTVSVDGTKMAARAAQRSNRTLTQLEQEIGALQGEMAGLLQQAGEADARELLEPSHLPQALLDKATRKRALEAARVTLAARQQAAHEQRLQQDRGEDIELPPDPPAARPPGAPKTPAAPTAKAAPTVESTPAAAEPASAAQSQRKPPPKRDAQLRINLVEPDSRVMCDAHGQYLQAYNIQAVVEAGEDRSQLVTGIRVTNAGNDRRLLAENLASVPAALRQEIENVLVDTGYDHADLIAAVERKYGCTVLCPPQNRTAAAQPKRRLKPGTERRRARAAAMRARFTDPAHQQLYKRRGASVEPVFGVFKNVLGFRRFRLFGIAKAGIEITLLALAYNVRQLARLTTRKTPKTT
jgi:transposase